MKNKPILKYLLCLWSIALPATAQEPKATNVYTSKFDESLEIGRWSDARSGKLPNGRQYLGPYADRDAVEMKLDKLPEHRYVRIRFDLFALTSWDGDSMNWGPDTLSMMVKGGPLLFCTNFCNKRTVVDPARIANGNAAQQPKMQSYPDEYPIFAHPAATGASGEGPKLGVEFPWKHMTTESNVYKIDVVFPHTAKDLVLQFVGHLDGGSRDESWGLDKIIVETLSGETPQSEKQLDGLWEQILAEDPVAANNAIWKVVGAGPKASAYIEQKWRAELAGKNKKPEAPKAVDPAERLAFEAIVAKLAAESFVTRQKAKLELQALGLDSLDLIVETMNNTKDPEIKRALKSMYNKLRRQLVKVDPDLQKTLVASRVSRIIRISANELKITSSAEGPGGPSSPIGAPADGYVPATSTATCVPHFSWDAIAGGKQWLQYDFPKPKSLSKAEVFWATPRHFVRLPDSWSVQYQTADGSWKPVETKDSYTMDVDTMNSIAFKAVETSAVRLLVELPEGGSAGVYEFRVSEDKKAR